MNIDIPREALHFLPLGGCGEIGMNLNLYAAEGKWLMVDCGLTFGDDRSPGADLVVPDPRFIEERRDDLVAIVLTHAHEDHLGALPYLWPRLGAPIYATPFTAAVLRGKLAAAGLEGEVPLYEISLNGAVALGPFGVRFVTVTHSIPEPNALALDTAFGTVVHTGDWKIDPAPLVGPPLDQPAFTALGEAGALALVCDSTNVFSSGTSGSEAAVRERLTAIVGACRGRVFVSQFSSNIARLESVARAAHASGRAVALLGRSLERYVEAARKTGYLADLPPFLSESEAERLRPGQVLYLVTGCQGEPQAALARIAEGGHPRLRLGSDDTVIFSSKIIPGNERPIGRLHNRIVHHGARLITEREEPVHVSGHPNRGELAAMYAMVKPRVAVPVHGEARHLVEHAALARGLGVERVCVVENGAMLRLAPDPPQVVHHVHSGRLMVDGLRLVEAESPLYSQRKRMLHNGIALLTLVLDGHGTLRAAPRLVAPGLIAAEGGEAALDGAVTEVEAALEGLARVERRDDATVHEAARLALRRHFTAALGKRPAIEIQIVRA